MYHVKQFAIPDRDLTVPEILALLEKIHKSVHDDEPLYDIVQAVNYSIRRLTDLRKLAQAAMREADEEQGKPPICTHTAPNRVC